MKRSEMVKKLDEYLDKFTDSYGKIANTVSLAKHIIEYLEATGIQPPSVPAIKIRGKDYPWGGGCTMRCSCNECEPNYPMNKWEPEND